MQTSRGWECDKCRELQQFITGASRPLLEFGVKVWFQMRPQSQDFKQGRVTVHMAGKNWKGKDRKDGGRKTSQEPTVILLVLDDPKCGRAEEERMNIRTLRTDGVWISV